MVGTAKFRSIFHINISAEETASVDWGAPSLDWSAPVAPKPEELNLDWGAPVSNMKPDDLQLDWGNDEDDKE